MTCCKECCIFLHNIEKEMVKGLAKTELFRLLPGSRPVLL
ncbi:hypothetical protein MmTuc01_2484 [Methanosarcina mazei Tuc01]|uniref:Uncharacterized protein n=1 Tax=Methanosarcina mazei Tuc01 TaxID=1236903 RepID=M1QLC0_METMZ|nr:hypothetical protein MmTuc01_2484 [Methanosarcina mazei Tuc01]